MNGLPDPIAGKGYANILPALKVPEFGEIASMQTANNQLALNAAKLAADQKAKADALAAAKVKAEKEAQDAAKKAEAKKQADAWTLLKPEDSPLIGDAPKWAAEAYDKMVKEAQGLMAQGIDLNSFDPKAVAFRSGTLQNYHVNYKRHSEVAKALAEKQKQWSTKPDDYESYSLADELGSKYNVTGWDKDYYTPSLLPKVGVATPAEIAAYEKQMFGESASRVSRSKKPIGYDADGDVIYSETESYEARPFEQTAEDVNKNLRYSTDTKQKQLYNFYYNQAKAQGMVDENDNILPQFLQKREETTREKGGVKPVTVQVQKEKSDGDGKQSTGLYTNKNGYFTWGNRKDAPQINFQRENLVTPTAQVATIQKALLNDNLTESQRKYYEAQLKAGKQLNNFPVVASIKLPGNASIADAPADAFRILTNGREVKPTPEQLVKLRPKLVQTPKVIKYAASKNGNWVSQQDWGEGNNELNSPNVDGFTGRIVTTTDDGEIVTINPIALGIEEKDYPQGFDQNFIANQYGQQVQQQQTPQNKTAPKTPPAMEMDFKGF